MILQKLKLGFCFMVSLVVGTLLIQDPSFFAYINSVSTLVLAKQSPEDLSKKQLCNTARHISLKVIRGERWGSGILVKKQGTVYSLVTNGHVLEKKEDYTIQTYDGKKYQAKVLVRFDHGESTGTDLAILQFNSSENYTLANLVKGVEREKVFAAGYPLEPDPTLSDPKGFMCTELGSFSLKLPQPMQEGYQLGSAISTRPGMSGGPLLNTQGKVVGINGKGSPLIFTNNNLYLYKNGSRVSESLGLPASEALELLASLSWAIPIETIVDLSAQIISLTLDAVNNSNSSAPRPVITNNPGTLISPSPSSVSSVPNSEENRPQIASTPKPAQIPTRISPKKESPPSQIPINVEEIAKQITVLIFRVGDSKGKVKIPLSGTGVIIAKERNTYHVLTIKDVVDVQGQYKLMTPGQKIYDIKINKISNSDDLALLEFTADENYSIAQLGEVGTLKNGNIVYVAGWLDSNDSASFTKIDGKIVGFNQLTQERILAYNNRVPYEMRGGVVLNQQGQLVAIHKEFNQQERRYEGIPISVFFKIAPLEVKRALSPPVLRDLCSTVLWGTCSQ